MVRGEELGAGLNEVNLVRIVAVVLGGQEREVVGGGEADGVSAEVLLLHRTPTGWATEPTGPPVLRRDRPPVLNPKTVRRLFGAAVRLSAAQLVLPLLKTPNAEWQALQQQHRLLKRFQLLELHDGAAQVGGYRLQLNERLGLLMQKNSEA